VKAKKSLIEIKSCVGRNAITPSPHLGLIQRKSGMLQLHSLRPAGSQHSCEPCHASPSVQDNKEDLDMKAIIAATLAATALVSLPAMAEEGPWLVRARIVNLNPADKSDAIPALGVPADAITVNSKVIPDVDFSYFFSPNIAAELLLTIPQKHDVKVGGANVGTVKHLPPTLLAQYHFNVTPEIKPYIGAGINLTLFSDLKVSDPTLQTLDLSVSGSSVGPAVQAGIDFKIAPNWYLNADVKYIKISTDLKAGGTKVSSLKIDPVIAGVGVGYRF
jgi:outer membrane protein